MLKITVGTGKLALITCKQGVRGNIVEKTCNHMDTTLLVRGGQVEMDEIKTRIRDVPCVGIEMVQDTAVA